MVCRRSALIDNELRSDVPNHAARPSAGGPTFNLIANSHDLARDLEAGMAGEIEVN